MTKPVSPRGESMAESIRLLQDQRLWLKILIGMALGILTGMAISPEGLALLGPGTAFKTGEWLALPGVLFLGLIQMVIIPLVVTSIILGVAESGSIEFLRKIGLRIIPYFIVTTAISITIGVFLVQTFQPGEFVDQRNLQATINTGLTAHQIPEQTFEHLTIPERISNLIPTNLTRAGLEKNFLQIVLASIIIGIALISIPAGTGKPFRDLCVAGQVLTMKVISWAMILAPYAVFGLLASITIKLGIEALFSVGFYALTVLCGLGCMLILYLLIVALLTKFSIREFIAGVREVQLLAFSTSSSAATMPFSIQAAEEKLKIRPEISRFIIPLGATINMDGTALYQGVAALFLCQIYGIDLTGIETVLLISTIVGASIGTPATPGVGLVVLATILTGLGVPAEGIALIIGVDRILDMCRTAVNVTGDLTASAVMNRWMKEKKDG